MLIQKYRENQWISRWSIEVLRCMIMGKTLCWKNSPFIDQDQAPNLDPKYSNPGGYASSFLSPPVWLAPLSESVIFLSNFSESSVQSLHQHRHHNLWVEVDVCGPAAFCRSPTRRCHHSHSRWRFLVGPLEDYALCDGPRRSRSPPK